MNLIEQVEIDVFKCKCDHRFAAYFLFLLHENRMRNAK